MQVFHPGIAVAKTADPTTLLGGGEVTYTYEVTNTGDVPLSGVAEGITDDTCTPVTFVSGDEDGDGLLDTPTSIFEDALDETWIFTCTTTVTETTTNVVTVPGTPTDPDGQPLCGSTEPLKVAEPCDVTDNGTATVTVVDPGSITVIKRADPDTSLEFPFAFADEPFTLTDGASRTFDSLAPGDYTVLENASDGWDLTGITCDDPTGTAAVDLTAGNADHHTGRGRGRDVHLHELGHTGTRGPAHATTRYGRRRLPAGHWPRLHLEGSGTRSSTDSRWVRTRSRRSATPDPHKRAGFDTLAGIKAKSHQTSATPIPCAAALCVPCTRSRDGNDPRQHMCQRPFVRNPRFGGQVNSARRCAVSIKQVGIQ